MIITQYKKTDPDGNCSIEYHCRSTAFEDYLLQTQDFVQASVQDYLPRSSSTVFKPKHRPLTAFKRETADSRLVKILY